MLVVRIGYSYLSRLGQPHNPSHRHPTHPSRIQSHPHARYSLHTRLTHSHTTNQLTHTPAMVTLKLYAFFPSKTQSLHLKRHFKVWLSELIQTSRQANNYELSRELFFKTCFHLFFWFLVQANGTYNVDNYAFEVNIIWNRIILIGTWGDVLSEIGLWFGTYQHSY